MFRELTPTKEVLEVLQNTNIKLLKELDEKNDEIRQLQLESSFFGGRKRINELTKQIDTLTAKAREDWETQQLKINELRAALKEKEEEVAEMMRQLAREANIRNSRVQELQRTITAQEVKIKTLENPVTTAANAALNKVPFLIFKGANRDVIQAKVGEALNLGYKLQSFNAVCVEEELVFVATCTLIA